MEDYEIPGGAILMCMMPTMTKIMRQITTTIMGMIMTRA
ncbi:MAG: hypothetical protein CM15mP74_28260 [Halieaceae bacterium]|nr:MAG: hypothetical protein CM15mP74_28260 [Halieaceae bacterium]